jgi:hypothetical protein
MFVMLFNNLQIPVKSVARGNHKVVLNERSLHHYMNKVEMINMVETSLYNQW